MKVLLTTDGSVCAATALRTAMRVVNHNDRELDVLCVVPPYRRDEESANRLLYEKRTLSETTRFLEAARLIAAPGSKSVHLMTEIGSPAVVIADRSADYDLTVIGSRGIGFRSQDGLGPVANRIVEHAPGPVLIGRALMGEDTLRILVAVDGSAASRRAVETLRAVCDLSEAEVCLMYVAETPWLNMEEGEAATESEEEIEASEAGMLQKEFVGEGQGILERARDILGHPRLLVNMRIEEGNPAEEILAEAERGMYDLVVLGATGNRDVKHSMLGSVSSRIAWDAPCSVLIVREPGETG